ncbi:MAG: NAD(P)-dependent oxidoreductase [Pseudomonadota bacterium]
MPKPKVYIYTPVDQTGESHRRFVEAGCDLRLGDATWHNLAAANENHPLDFDADTAALLGVAARRIPITREVMEKAASLRIVAKYTVGVDDVDIDAATDLGVLVTHCPTEANWSGVAEGVMAYMLALLKKVREKDRHMKQGGWRDPALMGIYLGRRFDGYGGITVGIIGLGRIGSRLADLLAPWRVRILACDPYVDESKFIHHDVRQVDLETLLRSSDVVTLHCDLTEETKGFIGDQELGMMKPNAVLINAARGPMVDLDALYEALSRDAIAGAAIDVFPEEPPDVQLPLRSLGDKVLLSPHMITNNRNGGLEPAFPLATEAVLAALRGEVPDRVYNREVIPAWRERFGEKNIL